ncbi:pilus assembly protein TadG-related protein [Nesterenkonia alba]|uniref:pilus assembly protein TadG-related protein n=1 Tax=Nesterenkonia alba TaxID=515814 RepID=UPI000414BC26|nr:pilus assembly protein TadG-related protein [Nesterenkonia alba]
MNIVLAITVLIAGMGLFIFGQASDSRGKAQKAADAAALAAAQDIRTDWAQTWIENQTAPTSPDSTPSVTDAGNFAYPTGSTGHASAVNYATHNDNSSVTHFASSNAGYRTIHVRVDTLAEDTEEVGTADRFTGAPQAEANATAEVQWAPGVSCSVVDVEFDDDELESWAIRCTGASAGTVRIEYEGSGTLDASYDPDEVASLFEVRLVD